MGVSSESTVNTQHTLEGGWQSERRPRACPRRCTSRAPGRIGPPAPRRAPEVRRRSGGASAANTAAAPTECHALGTTPARRPAWNGRRKYCGISRGESPRRRRPERSQAAGRTASAPGRRPVGTTEPLPISNSTREASAYAATSPARSASEGVGLREAGTSPTTASTKAVTLAALTMRSRPRSARRRRRRDSSKSASAAGSRLVHAALVIVSVGACSRGPSACR